MRKASFVLVALLAVGCGSSGIDLGSILGSGSQQQTSDVRGTVVAVDANAGRIDLDAQYINNLRDTNSRTDSIWFDNQTRVTFNNQDYRVSDLERGDEISVTGYNNNGRYYAQVITVTRDVSR